MRIVLYNRYYSKETFAIERYGIVIETGDIRNVSKLLKQTSLQLIFIIRLINSIFLIDAEIGEKTQFYHFSFVMTH